MMRHLDDGSLQALIDNELPEFEEHEARRHLAACGACRELLAEVSESSRVFSSAMAVIDVPASRSAPPAAREPVATRVRPLHGAGGAAAGRSAGRWAPGAVRRAAAILIVAAGGASATIPGSPVREWLAAQRSPIAAPAVAPANPEIMAAAVETGVSVTPAAGQLRIVLVDPGAGVHIRVLLTESARGGAFAEDGAGTAAFRAAAGRIEVAGAAGGRLRVEIPTSADDAAIVVDGVEQVVKEGGLLRVTAAGERDQRITYEVVR